MSSKLPLVVRVAIRDTWDKEDGPLQTTLKSLQELLGHQVSVDPEWHLIVTALDDYYSDKANLVSIVVGCIQVWAKGLIELLDGATNEAWTEQLLEKVPVTLRVFVDVAASDKASTAWSEQRQGFIVCLPKRQVFQPAELLPTFRGHLLTCFETDKRSTLVVPVTHPAADDWAEVQLETRPAATEPVDTLSSQPEVEFLPDVASLPRPDELLLRPPYHLTLAASRATIEIHGSHSPTLQVLADYLKRWCRVNHNDTTNPPGVQITLHQCAFGLGEMFDRLTLSTEETRYTNQFRVTAPIVIALIEGVLGYELLSTQSGTWNFRRNLEFKRL
ncbi:hypothetical protein QBC44DRAFT_369473 [Cladorrhinum sp. PSN332]|nr:hypothetical protein QBC44DRAFT_369473 [Cladorrhinum sp. PSN332]